MREVVRAPKALTADESLLTDRYLDILFLIHKLDLTATEVLFVQETFAELQEILLSGQMSDALRREMVSRIEHMRAAFLSHQALLTEVARIESLTEDGTLGKENINTATQYVANSLSLGLPPTSSAQIFLRLERCIQRSKMKHDEFELMIGSLRMRGIVPHVYVRYV